jgi:hypothetical protein
MKRLIAAIKRSHNEKRRLLVCLPGLKSSGNTKVEAEQSSRVRKQQCLVILSTIQNANNLDQGFMDTIKN